MSNVQNTSNSGFFPKKGLENTANTKRLKNGGLIRNDAERKSELDNIAKSDAKVTIPDSIKDFSRIKKAVDMAPEIDKTDKIADLKARIANGTYKVDHEALADKILEQEF